MEEKDEKSVNHVFDTDVISFDIAQKDKYVLDLQGKFEVVLRKGKYYIERIKSQYPKTHEECCKVLAYEGGATVIGYDAVLLNSFQKLKLCRDAYWKVYGEQMGLGKPWERDWNNLSTTCAYIKINKGCFTYSSRVLIFPTEEMRDAFYENFKDLINECKELL